MCSANVASNACRRQWCSRASACPCLRTASWWVASLFCACLCPAHSQRRFAARNGSALDEQHCCLLSAEFQGRAHQPRGQPPSLSCFLQTFPALWAGQRTALHRCGLSRFLQRFLTLQTFPALWASTTAYSASRTSPLRDHPNLAGQHVQLAALGQPRSGGRVAVLGSTAMLGDAAFNASIPSGSG